jgi:thiol-disulfide isomerase/thioredoxin
VVDAATEEMMRRHLFLLPCAALALACAGEPIMVTGRLLGHDGRPLPKAFVTLSDGGTDAQTVVTSDGRFALAPGRPGGFFLRLEGAHHDSLVLPLLVEGPGRVELEVRLRAAPYADSFEEVTAVGEFNRFEWHEGAIPLQRQPDGSFTATLPAPHGLLGYQLLGVLGTGWVIEGPQADDYVYDESAANRRIVSIVKAQDGKARIVFDPRRVVRSDRPVEVRFIEPRSRAARLAALSLDVERRWIACERAAQEQAAAGQDPDASECLSREGEAIARKARSERDALVRGYLLLSYFHLPLERHDADVALRTMAEIPPASPLWSLRAPVLDTVAVAGGRPDLAERYAGRVVEEGDDRRVRAGALYFLLREASLAGRAADAERHYRRLTAKLGDTGQARQAREEFAPDRLIMAGRELPDFAVPSLDRPGAMLTKQELRGRTYLIDFWATWCGVCVADFDRLKRLHERYRDRGFTILSLAVYDERAKVEAFRKQKGALPWLNGFVSEALARKMEGPFELRHGVPVYILVDENGMILGSRFELIEGGLERALQRLFEGSTAS